METKDQTNQNPEGELTQPQAENSQSADNAEAKKQKNTKEPAEKQDAKEIVNEKKEKKTPKKKAKSKKEIAKDPDIIPETPKDEIDLVKDTPQEKTPEKVDVKTEIVKDSEVIPETQKGKTDFPKNNSEEKASESVEAKPEPLKGSLIAPETPEVENDSEKEVKEVKEVSEEKTPEDVTENIESEPVSEVKKKVEDVKDEDKVPEVSAVEEKEVKSKNEEKKEVEIDASETIGKGDENHEELEAGGHDDEAKESEPEIDYDVLSREELVELLESAVNEGEVQEIKRKVALIKVAFLKLNKIEQEKKIDIVAESEKEEEGVENVPVINPLEMRFDEAFNIYRRKRKEYLAEQDKIKLVNLEAKKVILEELKALIDSEESLRKTYDEFKALQERWKEIGMVPKGDLNNLWQSYHFFVEKFFDKVKINRELRDLDLKKNLEAKIALCEKSEELLLENSIVRSFKELQKLHEKWREVGPAPLDKKDELWDRFKSTTDKINQRRHEHYLEFQEEQKNNLLAKTALCENAEELITKENTSIKHWQTNTAEITDLLKVWKTLGPAPRKNNDEIWERFKSSLDSFFTSKKEYFQKIKEEQQNNYNLKLDLCVQSEALKSSTEWRNTTGELINLQKEWKAIGPVPRKHSDKIWKRFRAACDEFFNSKSEYYGNIGKHETENQKLKEELIEKVKVFEFEGGDKKKSLEVLKDFQREWTNIGHVPIKEKNRLQNDFRSAVNGRLDELKISQTEMQTASYRQRMEGIKDKPDAKRILYNERTYLSNKRNKLIEEIGLWENNLGFFAASKKANLLKEEFEKKILKAKGELELLKAKIKFLDQQG